MRTAYKVIAHLIAAAVVLQAGFIAWGVAAMLPELQTGVTSFPAGALAHGLMGMYVIPVLALALLVAGLLAHAGVKWALFVLLAVVVQVALAYIAFAAPLVGLLHGINAFSILVLAEVGAYAVAHAPERAPRTRMRPAV